MRTTRRPNARWLLGLVAPLMMGCASTGAGRRPTIALDEVAPETSDGDEGRFSRGAVPDHVILRDPNGPAFGAMASPF